MLDDEGQSEFRSAVGRIGYVANSSRPDLSYMNLVLSMNVSNATKWDLKMAIKAFKKMKSGTTTMKFIDLGSVGDRVLEGYGDAGFKSLPNKLSSCCGYVILLTNKKMDRSSILDWKSNKIRRVVASSTSAEALASNETLDACAYVKCVLKELLQDSLGASDIPIDGYRVDV